METVRTSARTLGFRDLFLRHRLHRPRRQGELPLKIEPFVLERFVGIPLGVVF